MQLHHMLGTDFCAAYLSHSDMASTINLIPITDHPHLSKSLIKAVPLFLPLPLNRSLTFCSFKTKVLTPLSSSRQNAVSEQAVDSFISDSTGNSENTPYSTSSKLVLVVGGTGGVGQLVVASLLDRNIKSRLLLRNPEKAASLFGEQDDSKLQVYQGDTRNPKDLVPAIFEGVTHVICCTGTTAFPSRRWDGDNTPERVDWEGVRNLVSALPSSLKRLVLVSSIGVTKFNELPWSIMNVFGVLKYKKMGEDFVRNSGHPYTIIRLTDGPYTSYDLNTLLQATAGERRAVLMGQGDKLVGEVSRLVVAEACIQALDIDFTEGEIYEINSVQGEGPGSDLQKWQELFRAAQKQV
ncbi:NAD(P)-binding Rossmann-fold superfamily protein [Striga asiatica]|uniref:NAD(P)-binding Rossmann-fold superfamily protein n=1 Tax=Striga asiatica TaxID=4170 RepID=A0A5A7RBP4_STRAF|nr:NAD(P)-binding Rossmann-fold superfamily protein [Striga asiatica]